MARRALWWLALPLLVSGWLSARWVAHLLSASDAHEAAMAGSGHGVLHLCGACVLMLVLLVVLVLGRPVLRLGFEYGSQLAPARAPRPPLARSSPLRVALFGPDLSRPSILACGHLVRAPPAMTVSV